MITIPVWGDTVPQPDEVMGDGASNLDSEKIERGVGADQDGREGSISGPYW